MTHSTLFKLQRRRLQPFAAYVVAGAPECYERQFLKIAEFQNAGCWSA
jgi:hypothetical protein